MSWISNFPGKNHPGAQGLSACLIRTPFSAAVSKNREMFQRNHSSGDNIVLKLRMRPDARFKKSNVPVQSLDLVLRMLHKVSTL